MPVVRPDRFFDCDCDGGLTRNMVKRVLQRRRTRWLTTPYQPAPRAFIGARHHPMSACQNRRCRRQHRGLRLYFPPWGFGPRSGGRWLRCVLPCHGSLDRCTLAIGQPDVQWRAWGRVPAPRQIKSGNTRTGSARQSIPFRGKSGVVVIGTALFRALPRGGGPRPPAPNRGDHAKTEAISG